MRIKRGKKSTLLRTVPGVYYVLSSNVTEQKGNVGEIPGASFQYPIPCVCFPKAKATNKPAENVEVLHRILPATKPITFCSYLPYLSHLLIALLLMHLFFSLSCEFLEDKINILFIIGTQ